MEKIEHKYIEVNDGLKLHVAEIGSSSSPVVLFLHGFPEVWYSWRHQMIAVAKAGFRAIAPDCRGYGLSDIPPQPDKTTFADVVFDLVSLLDSLSISKAFIIGKDAGSHIALFLLLQQQDRISGIVTIGMPFMPLRPITYHLPEGFYVSRFQEPGRAEADFGRFDVKTVWKNIYILFSRSEMPIAGENEEIMDMVERDTPLPPWLSEDDFATYGALYEKSGFSTPLHIPYRGALGEMAFPDPDPKIEIPTLLLMGEKDYVLKFPGREDYIRSGDAKVFAPNLDIIFLPEGTHFVQEQFPNQVNEHILNFLMNIHV